MQVAILTLFKYTETGTQDLPALSSLVEMLIEKGILMGQVPLGLVTRTHNSTVALLSATVYADLSRLTSASVGGNHIVICATCTMYINIPSSSVITITEGTVSTMILGSSRTASRATENISVSGSTR